MTPQVQGEINSLVRRIEELERITARQEAKIQSLTEDVTLLKRVVEQQR